MSDIQFDMFEVQLGAAILLQFRTDTGLVRVLADAGVKAKGYPPDHVLQKLLPLLDATGERRIDLVIGTHYDEDHLIGLVPVIEDMSIMIGEAWMPPVVNDTEAAVLDAPVRLAQLLPQQFAGEGGSAKLAAYLASKRADCELLYGLEGERQITPETLGEFRMTLLQKVENEPVGLDYFREQLDEAHQGCGEGGIVDAEPHPMVKTMVEELRHGPLGQRRHYWPASLERYLDHHNDLRMMDATAADVQVENLAELRQGAAKDAVNASALHDVVQALSKRSIPIRSEIIDDGEPRRYRWNAGRARFQLTADPNMPADRELHLARSIALAGRQAPRSAPGRVCGKDCSFLRG